MKCRTLIGERGMTTGKQKPMPEMQYSARDEYDAANDIHRHFNSTLVAELTASVALSGGLLAVLYSESIGLKGGARVAVALLGAVQAICFAACIESTRFAAFHFAVCAARLEKKIGYRLWRGIPGAPEFRVRPRSWALRMLTGGCVVLWLAILMMEL